MLDAELRRGQALAQGPECQTLHSWRARGAHENTLKVEIDGGCMTNDEHQHPPRLGSLLAGLIAPQLG